MDLVTSALYEAAMTETMIPAAAPPRNGLFDRFYRWTIGLAQSRHAPLALGAIAFAESSFFPIPPDALLIPMSIAKPRSAWAYALICTIGSVLGAMLGYAIGALLYDTAGHWLIQLYGYGDKIATMRAFYAKWGALAILIKGLTPIPFKLVTIVSGLMGYNFSLFVVLAAITRGARFFIVAVLMRFYGAQINALLERWFGWFLGLLVVAVIGGFWAVARFG